MTVELRGRAQYLLTDVAARKSSSLTRSSRYSTGTGIGFLQPNFKVSTAVLNHGL